MSWHTLWKKKKEKKTGKLIKRIVCVILREESRWERGLGEVLLIAFRRAHTVRVTHTLARSYPMGQSRWEPWFAE